VASKEPLARQFGATDFVDASAGDAAEQIRSMLPPEKAPFGAGGLDFAFECVGHPAVLRSAIDTLDWGGTCVVVGVPSRAAELTVPITPIVHVDRAIIGTRYGSSRPQHDIPLLVQLYLEGKLMLDELVSQTYPLEQFDAVVGDMHEGRLARGVLVF
jgi:S-(hydroxymethyl)glutathione dehydrogenase/alcohol dehydrogenase